MHLAASETVTEATTYVKCQLVVVSEVCCIFTYKTYSINTRRFTHISLTSTLSMWLDLWCMCSSVSFHSAYRGDLIVPRTTTLCIGRRSSSFSAAVVWNSFLLHLWSAFVSRRRFSGGLKTHPFNQADIHWEMLKCELSRTDFSYRVLVC